MSKATADKIPGETPAERERKSAALYAEFGVTAAQVREAAKPLFLLMVKHGITTFEIERDGHLCHTRIG